MGGQFYNSARSSCISLPRTTVPALVPSSHAVTGASLHVWLVSSGRWRVIGGGRVGRVPWVAVSLARPAGACWRCWGARAGGGATGDVVPQDRAGGGPHNVSTRIAGGGVARQRGAAIAAEGAT